jgi:hypothetical protein
MHDMLTSILGPLQMLHKVEDKVKGVLHKDGGGGGSGATTQDGGGRHGNVSSVHVQEQEGTHSRVLPRFGDALQVQIDVSDTGDYDTGDHYNTEHARVRLNL